jgi:ATP-binding cassette subfamily B protein
VKKGCYKVFQNPSVPNLLYWDIEYTRTELLIQQALNQLMHHRTSFVIAHRLSTISNADLVIVIENGRIAEQGAHETLLAEQGVYHRLYHSQFRVQMQNDPFVAPRT